MALANCFTLSVLTFTDALMLDCLKCGLAVFISFLLDHFLDFQGVVLSYSATSANKQCSRCIVLTEVILSGTVLKELIFDFGVLEGERVLDDNVKLDSSTHL